MIAPPAARRSLIPDVGLWRRERIERCQTPACDHVHAYFPAPRHLLARSCAAVDWWSGCVAAFAGSCWCPGCHPLPADGPARSGCGCPPDEPAGML